MQVIETKVYTFNELNEEAKEKARAWYRENDNDSFSYECVIEDAKEIAALMGIDIDKIYYSGFYSQDDGAWFMGEYAYKKGALEAAKEYAPLDETLHAIASELQAIQRRNFYRLTAIVNHNGHYYHEQCTSITVENNGEYFFNTDDNYVRGSTHDGAMLVITLRKFMKWMYRQLEKQHEWVISDESVANDIRAKEYTFTASGKRFG